MIKYGLLPPRASQLFERIKYEPIQSMIVVRTPIQSLLTALLNIITLGQSTEALKQSGYDRSNAFV